MEPLAIAAYVMIAAAAVLAIFLGALAGAVAWAAGIRLFWAGLLAAAIYFVVRVGLESASPLPAAIIGMPPLILTCLASWLAAYFLEARAKLRRIWAALSGLGGGLLLGFLWGFSLRLGPPTAASIALVADGCLLVLLYRIRSVVIKDAAGRLRL